MTTSRGEVMKMTSAMQLWLEERENAIAELLVELVGIATENPSGRRYRECVDFLEGRLRGAGFECERILPELERTDAAGAADYAPEILMGSYGNGARTFYFHGHYDVVPAQSASQFVAARREHFLFGRGSSDMKGGIVAMLYAILALKEFGVELDGRIRLMLVPNEETGGADGTGWLVSRGVLDRDAVGMLLAEPTSGVIWNANRGAISVRVRVLGKAAHVGLQHQGENAFERMHLVVARLQELKRDVERRATRFEAGSKQAAHSILMLGGESGGGTNFNVVPGECWFTVDRRINPEEDFTAEKAALIGVLERCRADGIPLEWEIFQEGAAAACDEAGVLGRTLAAAVQDFTGAAPKFEMCPGLLENRFYAGLGIPAMAYGPGVLAVSHGPNEYVDVRKIVATAGIYARTAVEMLGGRRND